MSVAMHRLIDNPPSGTGDLLAAVFLARLLEGLTKERALQLATASVYEIIARSRKRGADELTPNRMRRPSRRRWSDAPPHASESGAQEIGPI